RAAMALFQTLVLDSPGHSRHLEGAPALAVILVVLGLIAAFIIRFFKVRRHARLATQAKGAAEAELRTLFAAMQDIVFVVDRNGNYTRVPTTNASVPYRPTPDLVGRNVSDVLPAEAATTICNVSAQVVDTQRTIQTELKIQAEGRSVWFAATASPFDGRMVLWVARDITETRIARDALAHSERRYRLLFDRNPCAMWVYDFDTRQITEVNDAAVAQYGFTRDEFARMKLDDLRASDDVGRLSRILAEMPSDEPRVHVVKHRRKDGSVMDVETRGHPLGIPGRHLRLVVITDVTERLAAEHVVREAEKRAMATSLMLQDLIDAAPQAMIVLDANWNVTRWNDAAEALFGWSSGEVVGAPLPFVPEDQRERVEAWHRSLEHGVTEKPTEAVRTRKDGTRVNVMLAVAPLVDADGHATAFIAVYMDITERKLLEEQLRQSQKMEAIGTLAGGVAHDFNNILTVISSYAAMLMTDDRYPDIRADIEEISSAARRATGLTRQLLTFSRKAIVQLQSIDINSVVEEMHPMLRRLLMEHIQLIIKPSGVASSVMADLSQLEQILLNLTVNAADAMPDGGSLVIETHNVWLDEAYAEMHTGVVPGPYVLLAVTDSGTGMDADTIRKIFEPFFTTKEIGRGTGLGLATIYAIVKQLGGHIWVYSEPQQGAAFKIYLPRDMSAAPAELAPVPQLPQSATGTVLLVEDDTAVRRAARRMLERVGFRVIEAQDGEEGLSVAAGYDGEITVVVTDLMMPRMNGGDFARALAVSRPGSRIVFTSGYTDDAVLRKRLVTSTHAFVQKPFTGDQLVRTITSVLAEPAS
ncbi:MAG TPA: PAS domain S-box protein, partial [Gemmatimonadaceae bacterium]|nr:PAS domain S-box protein [Gemmatimonadaceae bacterium]